MVAASATVKHSAHVEAYPQPHSESSLLAGLLFARKIAVISLKCT